MKKINIKAADPMPEGCRQPEPVVIEISGVISEDTRIYKDLKDVQEFFDKEADKLAKALIGSIAQGMMEPLVIKLLEHRVSLYHGVS